MNVNVVPVSNDPSDGHVIMSTVAMGMPVNNDFARGDAITSAIVILCLSASILMLSKAVREWYK
jgi:hypothetical protein